MIKGIIFDLGSTLVQFQRDWETVVREGAEAMATWYLKKKHMKLDSPALIEAFIAEREAGQKAAVETQTEVLAEECLRTALEKINAPPATAAFTEGAINTYFAPEEAAWQAYPDAVETLKWLQYHGYRLGLYSNATDNLLVQRIVNQQRLRPWLSPVFNSAQWGWRKPNPETFLLVAGRWEIEPANIAVVGDNLAVDILGANRGGMHSVLVTMDEHPSNADNRHIIPEAIASSLSALTEIIPNL